MNKVVKPLIFLLTFFTYSSHATDYYIDASVGSDSNPGTRSDPWKTIEKVNDTTFSPGDRIKFKRGETWPETLKPSSSGSVNKHIVYEDFGTGPLPRITGEKSQNCVKWNTNRSHLIFRNLHLHGCGRGGFNVWNESAPSIDIVIESCVIEKSKEWNIYMTGLNGLTIKNNVIRNAVNQHGIYLDGTLGLDNAIIEGNDIYGNKDMCVQFNSNGIRRLKGMVLRYNKLHDCGEGGVNNIGAQNLLAHHNLIYGDMPGIYNGCDGADSGCKAGAIGGKYYNNTIVTSGSGWATCFSNDSSTGNPDFKEFKNNICMHNAKSGPVFAHEVPSGSATSDYNVFFSGPGASREFAWKDLWYSDFEDYQSNTGEDKHSYNEDPLFTNMIDSVFALSPTSPATDKGVSLVFTRDLAGNPVPVGPGPDIGAIESHVIGMPGIPATPASPPRVAIEF